MATKYTVVQHSAFSYKGDEQFKQGLESRSLTTARQENAVIKAGGIVFDTYSEAEDFAEKAMYPAGYQGMTPAARGTFADQAIDGSAIYIPVREVVG